jgi:hypothetical protein
MMTGLYHGFQIGVTVFCRCGEMLNQTNIADTRNSTIFLAIKKVGQGLDKIGLNKKGLKLMKA